MQIGFNLPNSGPLSAVSDMTRLAVEGEAMGFDYLTFTDHVVLPDTSVPGYPYSESGAFYEEAPTERHEQLIGMSWIAAKTSRIRPGRRRARGAASSGGAGGQDAGDARRAVGRAAHRRHRRGWLKTEFDAVVTTPFAERAA